MMYKNFFFRTAVLTLLLFNGALTSAQVTIGDNKPPQSFSVLELISGNTRGLRLPQMTTDERDIMANDAFKANQLAMGLQIFNTSTFCVETWNGIAWISKCMDCEGITFPALDGSYTFCNGSKVSDLSAKTKGAVYSVASGGAPLAANTTLIDGEYYIEQRVANCGNETRTAVTVNLGDCSIAPSGWLNASINAMYDFQHQRLFAFAPYGGIVTDYKWQVSEDNITFSDIQGAPNSEFYIIPANFINSFVTNEKYKELYFRCILSNPAGSDNADISIMFVRTNTAGYQTDENGVRYLTIQRGLRVNNVNTIKGGNIKIALLNLGQSGTGAYIRNNAGNPNDVTHIPDNGTLNDAGDLGDFYQWGRIADGHQHTVWNWRSITPMTGNGATSDTVYRIDASHIDVSTGQVTAASSGDAFRGKFIITSQNNEDWGTHNTANNRDLWGNTSDTRAGAPTSLSGWTAKAQANNPCPNGWRIPSIYEFWDMYRGNGNDNTSYDSTTPYDVNNPNSNNIWLFRKRATSIVDGYAVGCLIIKNSNDECVILPSLGIRFSFFSPASIKGTLQNIGLEGTYSTSTYYGNGSNRRFYFSESEVSYSTYARADGRSVRCVKE